MVRKFRRRRGERAYRDSQLSDLICECRATEELRNHGCVTKNPKRAVTDRLLVEDCAESFRVVAQTPSVPFREAGNVGFA